MSFHLQVRSDDTMGILKLVHGFVKSGLQLLALKLIELQSRPSDRLLRVACSSH
jgi:hypothetical protein